MLVTSEMNKESVEIVTEHFPRLPGNEIKIGELFSAYLCFYHSSIAVPRRSFGTLYFNFVIWLKSMSHVSKKSSVRLRELLQVLFMMIINIFGCRAWGPGKGSHRFVSNTCLPSCHNIGQNKISCVV